MSLVTLSSFTVTISLIEFLVYSISTASPIFLSWKMPHSDDSFWHIFSHPFLFNIFGSWQIVESRVNETAAFSKNIHCWSLGVVTILGEAFAIENRGETQKIGRPYKLGYINVFPFSVFRSVLFPPFLYTSPLSFPLFFQKGVGALKKGAVAPLLRKKGKKGGNAPFSRRPFLENEELQGWNCNGDPS
jgi:hypothetical protein